MADVPKADAIRSYVDLRAFAADDGAGSASPYEGDAWLSARRMLGVPEGDITIAKLLVDGGSGRVEGQPADEFVIVLDGALSLDGLALATGTSAVIPAGVGFAWSAEPDTRAIVMRYAQDVPGADRIVSIDYGAERSRSNPPVAELLVGPTPDCRSHTDYKAADGVFSAGTWDATPYHRIAITYPHFELMQILEGSVTFADQAAGTSRKFAAGDVLVVTRGARCSWDSQEYCAKLWVIHRPE